jgi:hypothetical protein
MRRQDPKKALPSLKSLLEKRTAVKGTTAQTPDQMRAQLHVISAMYGLKLRTKPKGKGRQ